MKLEGPVDKERVFYANTLVFSVSTTEAAFIFGLRPIDKLVEAMRSSEKKDDTIDEIEEVEIARIHIPVALAERIVRDMAKKLEEEQSKEPAEEEHGE